MNIHQCGVLTFTELTVNYWHVVVVVDDDDDDDDDDVDDVDDDDDHFYIAICQCVSV